MSMSKKTHATLQNTKGRRMNRVLALKLGALCALEKFVHKLIS